ncbi:hypothetical protein HC891_25445 [Candidatus Gracilibacteria bacterium]|nr:hypothetical protein [Candidatus Gracilibacteria bacterium]
MHTNVHEAVKEAVATRNNGALFSLSFRRRLATYDALLVATDLTGPDRMSIQLLRAEADEQARVLNNYRMRMSELIATIDPAAPPSPDEAQLLRSDLLAQIERIHDARRNAAFTPAQELQIYADRIALVGWLFGAIDSTPNAPSPTKKNQGYSNGQIYLS